MELAEDVKTSLQKLPSRRVQELVVEVLQELKWVGVEEIEVTPGSSLGDGLMALIYRVRATGRLARAEKARASFVVKHTPRNKARRDVFDVPMLFANEHSFYENVVPALSRHCGPLAVAKFFHSITDGEHDALILEDLKEQSFRLADRRKGLDLRHCRVVLAALARLHAASFVLKEKNAAAFEQLRPRVKDMFWDADREFAFKPFTTSCFEETLRTLKAYFGGDDHENKYIEAFLRLSERGYDFIAASVRSTASRLQVVTHGDCWTNNLLFKYADEQPDSPSDVRFLDYQLTRITTPAADVTYFLFTSPNSILEQHHMDPEKIFSRRCLDEEMARMAPYGLTSAGIVVPAVCVPPEFTPDMDKVLGQTRDDFVQEYAKQMKADTPEARLQLASLLKHCVDRGFFKDL
ncbi:Hypothetical predicted protein [Cloeon dipterum]|uniref:CHK kinase-like domain-containing protein n=1 Tax=Cloeon dipterum TaxID=197152 RepID=A0A8S1DU80_9INSE|nr:Hypothetical predicted protein [Cloeon dipterum]